MKETKLPNGVWFYNPSDPLGKPGGFGAVFAGESSAGAPVAVKKLHITADEAAHREMRIANDFVGRSFSNVMPVLDAGEDAEGAGYFVVMPRAEGSLQDTLNSNGPVDDKNAAEILHQIATGLGEVPDIVHRDLKPANVLRHEEQWKIADFGIARFIEESTSIQTLKGFLSAPYAAPEQWELRHAVPQTDLYALGCIGYSLLTGEPPFPGPSREDYRQQHLEADPPRLNQHFDLLRSLLTMLLRKTPESRPRLPRVMKILEDIKQLESDQSSAKAGMAKLARAGATVAEREAAEDRQRIREQQGSSQRLRLFEEAQQVLKEIGSELANRIKSAAPATQGGSKPGKGWNLKLGDATLDLPLAQEVFRSDVFARAKWDSVTGTAISIVQLRPPYRWGSSLWFAKVGDDQDYRWHEVSYFAPFQAEPVAPYPLTNQVRDAVLAAAPGLHSYQIAYGPIPVDGEDAERFYERWALLFAAASQGKLSHPSSLPLTDNFFRTLAERL